MTQQPPRKLEMERPGRNLPAAPVTIIIVLLALCGGGAWYMLTQRGGPVPSELPSADSSSVRGRTFTGNAPAGTAGLPPGERDAAGRTGTGMAGAAGETSDGRRRPAGGLPQTSCPGPAAESFPVPPEKERGTGRPFPRLPPFRRKKTGEKGGLSERRADRDKADSGNIVEPPAGVRSPVLVTEPSGGRGASGSAGFPVGVSFRTGSPYCRCGSGRA